MTEDQFVEIIKNSIKENGFKENSFLDTMKVLCKSQGDFYSKLNIPEKTLQLF